MSEADTEQAADQVASPAETAGISPELAAVVGDQYSHILEDMSKENNPKADVSRETETTENSEVAEEMPENAESEENSENADPFQVKAIKVKGQEIQVTPEEYHALAQKGMRFTQKTQELSKHAKMGLSLEKANGGDKAAQKAILEQWASSGDIDDLVDGLEGVEGNIDTSAEEKEIMYQMKLDSAFEGINRKSSEFGDTIGMIESEAKGFLPDDLYSVIVDDPGNLRQLYDMVADGSFEQTKNIMSVRLAAMNPSDQAAIMSNPTQFGEMFDSLWESLKSSGSSNQQTTQTPTEKQTQTQAQQTASPAEEPPSMLSGTKREAQVSTDGDVDFFKNDKAYRALLRKIKQGY